MKKDKKYLQFYANNINKKKKGKFFFLLKKLNNKKTSFLLHLHIVYLFFSCQEYSVVYLLLYLLPLPLRRLLFALLIYQKEKWTTEKNEEKHGRKKLETKNNTEGLKRWKRRKAKKAKMGKKKKKEKDDEDEEKKEIVKNWKYSYNSFRMRQATLFK